MKNIPVSATRSFAIMGHTGSGKTTLVDALLYKMGVNDRLGSVDNGSSMGDWTDAEKARKITLQAKPFNGAFKTSDGQQANMVFCDTPGYIDFYGQVVAATSVSDAGVIVVDAVSGIEIGSVKAWQRESKKG